MAERFYLNLPLAKGLVELTGPEAHHLAQVRRLRPGDPVCLFNGDGQEYPGRIHSTQKKSVLIDIADIRRPDRELPFTFEIAAPLPKGDRAQFLIEKLTELGTTTFIPLETERSVIHPREGKLEKLERYVIEASKQCGRNVLMTILPLMKWTDFLNRRQDDDIALIAHPTDSSLSPLAVPAGLTCRAAVGPEGGFTDEEIDLALRSNWQTISLGPRILRIETAAIAVALCLAMR